MLNSNLYQILVLAGIILVALIVIGVIIARLYKRSSKEVSFVRTGFGGEKVILNGGAIVLPVLHDDHDSKDWKRAICTKLPFGLNHLRDTEMRSLSGMECGKDATNKRP